MPTNLSLQDLSLFDTLASLKDAKSGPSAIQRSLSGAKRSSKLPGVSNSATREPLIDIFDSRPQSTTLQPGSHQQHPPSLNSAFFQPLSPTVASQHEKTFSTPMSPSIQQTSIFTNQSEQPQDSDDFGDFVDSPSIPQASLFPSNDTSILVPTSNAGVQRSQSNSGNKPARYRIQSQINELGSNDDTKTPIRFGQHIVMPRQTETGTKKVSTDKNIVTARWGDIISSRPGPSATTGNKDLLFGATKAPQKTQKGPMLVETPKFIGGQKQSTSLFNKPVVQDDLIPKAEEEWESFGDEPLSYNSNDLVTTARLDLPTEYQNIPDSTALLIIFTETIFHLVDPFFKEIVPLSYSLKKRVLSNTKTKQFLQGFLETVSIGAQIMAGRYRRLDSSKPNASDTSDRAAREFSRMWAEELMPRLRTALPPSLASKLGDLSGSFAYPASTSLASSHCIVCGLSRAEQAQKLPLKISAAAKWDENSNLGHAKCLKFWSHRSVYGV